MRAWFLLALLGCGRDVTSMHLPASLPPSPDNAVADSDAAAELGFQIFFDARFSASLETRCATCHPPEQAFMDGQTHGLNTPTVFNAARETRQFWDGRVDALWKQPRFAFEREMDVSEDAVRQRIALSYRTEYEALFGPLGEGVFDNVGKALEAYMRKIASGPSRFDRGELTREETAGLDAFFRAGCDGCHGGPTLGSPELRSIAGEAVKSPSLRNIGRTAPYFHDGRFATLEEAIEGHGARADATLVAFLRALDGDYPPPPWNNWPQK